MTRAREEEAATGARPAPTEARVADVLRRVESAVRQRQAELATLAAESEELRLQLVELRSREYLQEPLCVSPRPWIGRLLVVVRKAFFHFFMKWYLHSIIVQQNAFNQAASGLLQALLERQEHLARHLERLARRVAELEAGESE